MASSSAVEDEQLTDSDLDDDEANKEDQRQEELRTATPHPAYSDEELNNLVEYVQRMTMLYLLDHRDWREEALDIIRRWLLEVNEPLLTIFYDDNTLTASLGLPAKPVLDLNYFVRGPNEIFSVENFHDEVQFGTVHSDLDGCLLRVLELIYGPIFRSYADWNDTIRKRFNKSLDSFLTFLTATHFKMGGMAVLYVPYVLQQIVHDDIVYDREFVKSLETIAIYWATQIRTILQDRTLTVANDFATLADEYEFWKYRSEVLQGLNAQLQQIDVQRIIKLLRKSNSVYTTQIDELIEQSKSDMQEAMSNIKFLHLLMEPCAQIDQAESPSVICQLIPRIIHLIRFIWLNSQHYNTSELITGLFRNLSNQLIGFCMDKCNEQQVLAGSPRFGVQMCNVSIDCCLSYKGIYEHISKQHKLQHTKVGWQLDEAIIFNHLDAFIERLNDVIDICEAMIVFGRLDESVTISKPTFGGVCGADFEQIVDNVEYRFRKTLKTLRNGSKQQLLNVHQNEWYGVVARYRETVQKLEEMVQRLISNVFRYVANVEEAIEALNATLFYSNRSSLRKTYLRQVSKVWQTFADEMDTTLRILLERQQLNKNWLAYYASHAISYRINLQRLTSLRDRLISSEWLPIVNETNTALLKFESLRQDFEGELRKSFKDWQNSSGAVLAQKCDRYLIVRSKKQKGLLECNIDPAMLEICQQAKHFEQLGFVVPAFVRKIFERHETISLIYNNAQLVCLNYNHILVALSKQERKLFRPFIQDYDRSISPGIFKLTYGEELSENFIADCDCHNDLLQEAVYLYKRANWHISRNCEKICDRPMLKLCFNEAVDIAVFENQLSRHVQNTISVLKNYYINIVELFIALLTEFQPFIQEMTAEWHRFINVCDDMLATAFLHSARRSLEILHAALHCDADLAVAPLLVLESDIKERQIVLTPDMDTIAALLSGTADRIHNILDQFPRLSRKLKLPKEQQGPAFSKIFREDAECLDLLRAIDLEIAIQREEMLGYVDNWNMHKALWETTEEDFTQRLKGTAMNAGVFEGSLEHYSTLADDISRMNAISHVHFLLINQNAIKSSILDCIEKWQALNIKTLLEHATSLIRGIYRYMRRNERKIMTVPRTLKETVAAKQLFEHLIADIPYKQSTVSPMLELFVTLDKYHVELSEKTRDQLIDLQASWLHYLKKLGEADEMLDNECEEFKQILLLQAQQFRLIIKEFYDDIYSKFPKP